ncbi:MAG: hypothetical protein ACO1OB_14845, partial [Archangium sp.]
MRTAQERSWPMLIAAASLALVVPSGLLAVRVVQTGASPAAELAQLPVGYAWVFLSSTSLAVGSAWWLARRLTSARHASETDPLT